MVKILAGGLAAVAALLISLPASAVPVGAPSILDPGVSYTYHLGGAYDYWTMNFLEIGSPLNNVDFMNLEYLNDNYDSLDAIDAGLQTSASILSKGGWRWATQAEIETLYDAFDPLAVHSVYWNQQQYASSLKFFELFGINDEFGNRVPTDGFADQFSGPETWDTYTIWVVGTLNSDKSLNSFELFNGIVNNYSNRSSPCISQTETIHCGLIDAGPGTLEYYNDPASGNSWLPNGNISGLLVRNSQEVPEPALWSVVLAVFGLIAVMRRKTA